jgi:septal ring factor EnvC (AmiA/AmiB activator)
VNWLFAFFIIFTPPCLWSQTSEEAALAQKAILEKEEEKRVVLRDLYRLHLEMKKASKERVVYESERNRTQESVASNRRMVKAIENRTARQRGKLKSRLRALYKFGDLGFVRIAFSRQGPADLDRTLRHLKVVIDWDYRLLKDYSESINNLRRKKGKLEKQLAQLRKLEDRVGEKQAVLNQTQKDKNTFLSKIDAEKLLNLARLKSLRKIASGGPDASNDPSEKWGTIRSMLEASFFERRGNLALPLSSARQIQGFGPYVHRKMQFKSKGIHLGSPNAGAGNPIKTVHGGKVVYNGKIEGYGQTLVVSHGDHYFTVYAGLRKSPLTVGEKVQLGQSVAESNEVTYFEVRHFSEPLNPDEWVSVSTTPAAAVSRPESL